MGFFFLSFSKPGYNKLVEYSEIGKMLKFSVIFRQLYILFLHIPKLSIFLRKPCLSALHL